VLRREPTNTTSLTRPGIEPKIYLSDKANHRTIDTIDDSVGFRTYEALC